MDAYQIIEEALKTCDEVLTKKWFHICNGRKMQRVVKAEEVEKIREILKKIHITSMPF